MWRQLSLLRPSTRNLSSATTVDSGELRHFKQFADDWCSEYGQMKPLHAMNKLRVPLIRDGILNIEQKESNTPNPLKGTSILDVGCGGGILSEPLARIGSSVTGIDANKDLVEKAKLRAEKTKLKLEYFCSSVEDYAEGNREKFDAVVLSEVLEHVTKKKEFLEGCLRCLKPGGSIFVTTINKTWIANLLGIVVAENWLNLMPQGTHQLEKFIKPHHLERMLEELGCKTVLKQGMVYNFVMNYWFWCSDDSVNYALHAVKLKKN